MKHEGCGHRVHKSIQQTLILFADTMTGIHVQRFKNTCVGFPTVAALKRVIISNVSQRLRVTESCSTIARQPGVWWHINDEEPANGPTSSCRISWQGACFEVLS